MSIIFVHGVNVRNTDEHFPTNLAARNDLLKRLILEPLGESDARFKTMQIANPYWGGFGANFSWNHASLPDVKFFESLGEEKTPQQSDAILAQTLLAIAGAPPATQPAATAAGVEALGAAPGSKSLLQRAAAKDLLRVIETLLTPILLDEMALGKKTGTTPEERGELQALLAIAAYKVATKASVIKKVKNATTDEEIIKLLRSEIQKTYIALVKAETAKDNPPGADDVQALGTSLFDTLREQVGELVGRTLDLPSRTASIAILDWQRENIHAQISRFLGDIFVYLDKRGDKANPGPIVQSVLDALNSAPANEPLIVITHSMGGNIVYDILTYFAPTLKVDIWVSVAAQVGHFEELKLFRKSDPALKGPSKVAKPKVGYWANLYDPADILSFRVDPIFKGVDVDEPFLTGANLLKAHTEYFGRGSFYNVMLKHLKKGLTKALAPV